MPISKEKFSELYNQMLEGSKECRRKHIEFFSGLYVGDDWTLVIKAHALIELLISELVTIKLNSPSLLTVFRKLPLSDKSIGKVKVAKELGVISKKDMDFIYKFSELRNNLVHKYENINFSFVELYKELDKGKKKAWSKSIQDEMVPEEINSENFRYLVWSGLLLLSQMIELKKLEITIFKKLNEEELFKLRSIRDEYRNELGFMTRKEIAECAAEILKK